MLATRPEIFHKLTMRTHIMDMFGLTAPILQAPIASASNVALATAVGRGGGMGSIAVTWHAPADGLALASQLKAAGFPFFFNFALRFGTEKLASYYQAGLPAVTLSWGMEPLAIAAFTAAGTRVGVQVGSAEGTRLALAAGADFIIVQGVEAGGHVQSTTALMKLLGETLALAGNVPVVAAGGIACGADIARVIKAGAQAVMMGTRFVASHESGAHAAYKAALVAAGPDDQVYTNCFDLGWPYAMHGVLRNSTFNAWEAAGCPAAPDRPGEGDIIYRNGLEEQPRYSDTPPAEGAVGELTAACLYAGKGVGHIKSVLPAGDIVTALWSEAQSLL